MSIARSQPAVGWAVAEELDRRLTDTHLELESRLGGSVLQKVAAAILDISVEGSPLEVGITQESLAEAVGASREAAGRALRLLERGGLIRRGRGWIRIVDAFALQSVVQDGSRAAVQEDTRLSG